MKKTNLKIIIIIAGVALVAIAALLAFHSTYLGWNGYNGYRAWPCAMRSGSIGGIMMLLWIVVVGALIYMIVRIGSSRSNSPGEVDALEVLKQRYAKGEISKAEFESMKQTLQ
ncbi:MAG: SHOCT domain-containing protein [Desulfobacterales bacterium]|nr:SHOCT domain-containing protein [Desulfobacterales bacterium]